MNELIRQIEVLNTRIAESGTGSVGAFLSTFDPHEVRIRGQKLDREAILAEFNKICAAQRAIVDIKAANALRVIAFKQLPLKSSAKLVGHCSFEPKARRAAIAMPSAQYFRLLQRVLDLEITPYQEARRKLGSVEQRDLLARLEQVPSLSMAKAKEVIGHNKVAKFSFDEDSASKLIGNRTNCALGPIFGDQWRKWTLAERDNVVRELLAIKSERGRVRHGRRRYGLSDEKAALLADLVLEDGYLGISLKAIAKVLPAMEQGERFGDVVTREYPPARVSPLQQLPTVKHFKPGLRNPVVIRTLTEMRRVVNALVKTFGKPARIRVELARDVQNGGEARLRIQKQQRDREQQRARALKQIEQLCPGREHPERWVEKLLLQQECGGRCPYTDQPITPAMALALDSPVEIEHIIPFSRSLDNSFGNKTLCFTDENRRKGNRAPSEHYDEQRLNEMLGRIDKWRGPWRAIAAKRRRFAATPAEVADMLDSFAQRQLNDTRHAAKEARDFLALLYGGYADGEGKQRVFAGSGTLTALLRAAWQLRQTMPEVKNKRDDHRHHAVDAICIGLASQSMVKALADASARKYARGKTRAFSFDEMPLPWPEFVADAGRVVGELLVSHRVNTSLSGRLHEETHYGGPEGEARVTKLIESVAATELEHILDPSARLAIVAALNGAEPKVKFKSPEMRAAVVLATKSGRYIQIKRVRLRGKRSTIRIGTGLSTRQVALGSNSHAEVFKHKDGKFDWRVVSRLEAYRRVKRLGLPRVDKSVPLGGQFVTSLLPNEAVLLAGELYRVTVLSEGEFACIHSREARPVTDVRKEKTITTTKAYMRVTSGIAMAKYGFRRVRLDSLGRLIDDE